MEIKRFRTVALYPHRCFECEVRIGERTVYASISIGKGEEIPSVEHIEGNCWIMDIPSDSEKADDGEDYNSYLSNEQRIEVLSEVVGLWNRTLEFKDSQEWETVK